MVIGIFIGIPTMPYDPAAGGGGGANHLLTEASDIITTEAGDQLITET